MRNTIGCLRAPFYMNGYTPESFPSDWHVDVSVGGRYLFTIFLDEKMFTCSKQYPLSSGRPLGLMFMGYCK